MTRGAVRRAAAALAVALALAVIVVIGGDPRAGAPPFDSECDAGNPYYAVSCLRGQSRGGPPPQSDAPSVLVFRDTPADTPSYALATFAQTGPTWGLAYRRSEPAIYAASYLKRGLPHGPGGPGAVYRLDLETGAVSQFLTVPNAGADAHNGLAIGRLDHDLPSSRWVGQRSLGDVELSTDQSLLMVMNLNDGRIYRFQMPTGALIGSFDHGAAGEFWAEDARPFALAVQDRWLYHGVVDSGVRAREARVYRSEFDGSAMEEVARLNLRYTRQRVRLSSASYAIEWQPWRDPQANRFEPPRGGLDTMAVLTDIEFTSEGDLVVALHDRRWDIEPPWIDQRVSPPPPWTSPPQNLFLAEPQMGFGDLLLARRDGDRFTFEAVSGPSEHFNDTNARGHLESALGGLARARQLELVVGGAFAVQRHRSQATLGLEGVYWWLPSSGDRSGMEVTCRPGDSAPYTELLDPVPVAHADDEGEVNWYKDVGTVGDIEALCRSDIPTATPTQTATATATATPTRTPTATPSPTPTRVPEPLYLPVTLREVCDPELSRSDIVLVLDASTSMEGEKFEAALAAAAAFVRAVRLPADQVGIVTFNRTSTVASPLSGDLAALEQAIQGIQMSPGTRIDSGLEAARTVLAGPERRTDAVPVVIVMTDGIQEAEPERPLELADGLREDGVAVFVIGLGTDVDVAYLEQLAAGREALYLSPSAEELVGIYEQLARLIPCPAKDYWGGR